jgi:ADP-ribosylation factor GTPase-activating protein 2/3
MKVSKLGASKLGAKKASPGVSINFEEAERKAKEEEERIKQLGYDRKKEEEEAAERKRKADEERRLAASAIGGSSSKGNALGSGPKGAVSKPAVPKLGFGQTFAAPVPKAASG